jgi:hypothetical protein
MSRVEVRSCCHTPGSTLVLVVADSGVGPPLVVRSEDHGDDGPRFQLTVALAAAAVGAAMFTLSR